MSSNKKLAIIIGSCTVVISIIAAVIGFFVYYKKNFADLFATFPEEADFEEETPCF